MSKEITSSRQKYDTDSVIVDSDTHKEITARMSNKLKRTKPVVVEIDAERLYYAELKENNLHEYKNKNFIGKVKIKIRRFLWAIYRLTV